MDPRLLRHYNVELAHLREMGAEFAQQFPKIAARLGMNGLEVADPYVERLLEGVAFLAARVQLKLDAEFPRFTQALLEMVYPHYLAPTPAMLVAQMRPDVTDPNLAAGPTVPRGATLYSLATTDETTQCEFRSAHDVRLWPLSLTAASYFSFAADLPLQALPIASRIRGGLRIRIKSSPGVPLAQLPLDRLPIYLAGGDEVANRLYELVLGHTLGALVVPANGATRWREFLPPRSIRPLGFEDGEALLPVTLRSFQGHRLLQEYFSFPQRFRFFELTGLSRAIQRADTDEIEIVLLFGRGDGSLENVIDTANLLLFCTPAINLFPKRADRVHVSEGAHEYHVVADRTRPIDFEIYDVTRVVGHGIGSDSEREFRPFYAAYSDDIDHLRAAYFTKRREPRLVPEEQKRRGSRTSYVGTEVFLSLVDAADAPYSGELRQLSIQTICTNRDLPLQMPLNVGKTDLTLDTAAPVTSIRIVSGPSRPYAPLADGSIAWRAVSHLSLNYLSLVNTSAQEGAAGLRELLGLYSADSDLAARRQIEGIRTVNTARVVRRLPADGPLTFGRGVEITLDIDDLAFEGGSAFLLGSVLSRYFARYVSINSFTETALRSDARGEISRWMPQWGARPTL
jgi:type VI secretion system protein ImpG